MNCFFSTFLRQSNCREAVKFLFKKWKKVIPTKLTEKIVKFGHFLVNDWDTLTIYEIKKFFFFVTNQNMCTQI